MRTGCRLSPNGSENPSVSCDFSSRRPENSQPSVIFFDEIDGLAPVRSSKQEQIHASIVGTLLALMDGMDGRGHGQVDVIGATTLIDPTPWIQRLETRKDSDYPTRTPRKPFGGIAPLELELLLVHQNLGKFGYAELVPSSARSTSRSSVVTPLPVPVQFVPLLDSTLEKVEEVVQRIVPVEKKLSALEEDENEDEERRVHWRKPCKLFACIAHESSFMELLVWAKDVVALHHLEGCHVQSLELGTLMTLAPADPILLLAVVDGRSADVPRDVKAWFGPTKDNRVELTTPSASPREAFFEERVLLVF
ncbi:hypothetical protein GALMADRAFT_144129 [Galerina marginata CBS 339.88]|uniref:ATPase AAA-type core domain-containing protein n=1 Tax=Galerina marginata (strain CBS 339.88) TaxID=685588 RepID=A0A067STN7_GALM3|nr:hypothetical protein GALMADRAFT_144129 [Galerina marginata CBS 339.88]